ncbi:predicted protein [Nematostella vectensis]|uniref:EGF-like domain-containing protein n=1 Tax=Nematostella vectensis TaxID=45351 RepID=A7RG75_NEMVE|nr:predicted protein [Nematostella vectensis]|eukprot:XP_001641542.1 predicted protein [Nematostella vectensis]
MRTWIWLIFAFFALNIGRKQVLAEDCRKANFGAVQEDKVLTGAVLATYAVFSEFECRVKCYTNHECLSVNLGPQVNGLRQCELNGAINDEETVLQSKMGFMYRGFKSVSLLQFYSALFCSFIFHVGLFGLRGWLNKSSGRLFESGRLFAMQKNPCLSTPCKNGATCHVGFTSKGFRCLCAQGYQGSRCDDGMRMRDTTSCFVSSPSPPLDTVCPLYA